MFDTNLINEKLYDYLEETDIQSLDFIKPLNDIVLRNPLKKYVHKYMVKIPIEKSTILTYNFLLSLSSEYASYFEERLYDGTIKFDKDYQIAMSFYDVSNQRRVVEIPLIGNIKDSYHMVHEILHDMNMDPNVEMSEFCNCRLLFTETISMLGELLFKDFLVRNNLFRKDNYKVIIDDFVNVYFMALVNDFEINLSKEFLQNGFVSTNFLKELYYESGYEVVKSSIDELLTYEQLNFNYNQRYIIRALLGCYMHDRIKTNPKNLGEFIDTNSMLNNVFFEDLVNYLDLSFDENNYDYVIFSDESLKKLEKVYKKELKLM